jgi:P-type E1-E2 ATPase
MTPFFGFQHVDALLHGQMRRDAAFGMDAEDVEIGSIIVIRPGERVPIDSVVIDGSADVDTSSMTGESLPVSVSAGSELSSGFIVTNGLLHARTVREVGDSAAARILSLVENANESKTSLSMQFTLTPKDKNLQPNYVIPPKLYMH